MVSTRWLGLSSLGVCRLSSSILIFFKPNDTSRHTLLVLCFLTNTAVMMRGNGVPDGRQSRANDLRQAWNEGGGRGVMADVPSPSPSHPRGRSRLRKKGSKLPPSPWEMTSPGLQLIHLRLQTRSVVMRPRFLVHLSFE